MQRDLEDRIRGLQAMPTGELRAEWLRVFDPPPRSGNVAWMRKRLIHAAQVAVLGDLSPQAKARLEYLMQFAPQWIPMGRRSLASRLDPTHADPPAHGNGHRLPAPGTVLTRPYKGWTIAVRGREAGIESDPVAGTVRDSLTKQRTWKGTATELLNSLEGIVQEQVARGHDWPKLGRSLSDRLWNLAPSLRRVGVSIQFGKREPWTGRRLIRVAKETGGGLDSSVTCVTPVTSGVLAATRGDAEPYCGDAGVTQPVLGKSPSDGPGDDGDAGDQGGGATSKMVVVEL